MEGFNSLLLKLRDAHEREMEGWQLKIQELSNKKGCDTRRMEELFSKNQQMKDQQRLLNETIQTLENRLRAGLCDRCTVTQELAKRRQQEFEASHMQSLQQVSLIAGEMNTLKKENRRLKEELKALKAALHSAPSSFSPAPSSFSPAPSSFSPAHRKLTQDLSPSGPALVATATSKASQQPADGDGVRKTEADPRKEDSEQRAWRSRHNLDSYKPLSAPPARKSDLSSCYAGEKRPPSVEALEQHPFSPPQSLLLKTSSGGELIPGRPVLHAPLPCRPQPIKSLPWSSPAVTSLMMSPSLKANLLHFPGLAPAESLRPGPVSAWHKQAAPKLNPAEQTVLFRLRSLPEHTEAPRRTPERQDKPCWTEKVGEGPREAYEGPLDLSEPRKSTSSQSPADYSPEAEPAEHSPEGRLKTEPSPQGDTPPSSSPQSPEEEAAAGSQPQVSEEEEEMNGVKEQSGDKKVPVLTISLRPVVLETLNSALQQEESLSPNDKPSSAEAENRQQEQNSDQEGNQSCKRKRSGVDTDSDLDVSHLHQERRVRITMTTEEKSSS